MPTILLIRHAQASFGSSDYDVLSEQGHEQVRALVAGLEARGIRPVRVLSGDLRRQRDTATACAKAAGVEVEVDPRWNEYVDRDILAGYATVPAGLEHRSGDAPLDSRQFQAILNDALRSWIEAGAAAPVPETHPAFVARLRGALEELARSLGRGETALAISSGGAIGAIGAALLGLPDTTLIAFNHVSINTGIAKLAVGRGGINLISVNEHGHLEAPGRSLVSYR